METVVIGFNAKVSLDWQNWLHFSTIAKTCKLSCVDMDMIMFQDIPVIYVCFQKLKLIYF